ncbi:protein CutA homolog [Hermetia illucens]|uniref:protein CutA homolog n=1 Tax=Hermetia illucens TaxID=343691 RepID=UPI0018CC7A2E|nr:protein CutA homolog [Hermetia illucens]
MKVFRSYIFSFSYLALFVKPLGSVAFSQCSTVPTMDRKQGGLPCTGDYTPGASSVALVTTPDETSAKKIANGLISKKLAACVNIVPRITSIYEWEGKVNEDSECLIIIKTRTSRVEELVGFVRENHPYSVAEVISLPIENGNFPYLDWIAKTVPEKSK